MVPVVAIFFPSFSFFFLSFFSLDVCVCLCAFFVFCLFFVLRGVETDKLA